MRVGFVGAGNMAGGLARGWAAARGEPGAPEAMLFADADPAKAKALAEEVGGEAIEGNVAVADGSDLVVLAVKPNVLDEVAPDLVQAGTPVLSILAGTTTQDPPRGAARHRPGPGDAEPRGAAAPGRALRGLRREARSNERERVAELLSLLGDVIELDEDLIDAATAIMGCSPGYLALMAEVLVEAGVREGLTEDQALRMVARAMSATGGLLDLHDPGALKRAVASPGGMTEAGLNALEEHKIQETLNAAVDASLERVRK